MSVFNLLKGSFQCMIHVLEKARCLFVAYCGLELKRSILVPDLLSNANLLLISQLFTCYLIFFTTDL